MCFKGGKEIEIFVLVVTNFTCTPMQRWNINIFKHQELYHNLINKFIFYISIYFKEMTLFVLGKQGKLFKIVLR